MSNKRFSFTRSTSSASWRTTKQILINSFIGLVVGMASQAGFAKDFHVAITGNDANAGSSSAPYRTIQKAAEVMKAGDICYIHAGTYYETVRPASSGAAGRPLAFTAYNNDVVTVHGGKPVTGWTKYSGNIYQAAVADPVKDLFVNGQYMLWARHPNMPYDPAKGFDMLRPKLGTTNPPANVDWTGVTVFRPSNKEGWWNKVSKENAYVLLPDDLARGGWLMGVPGLIDSEGEWCWKNGTLYLYPPGGKDPSKLLVEIKVRDTGFDLSRRDYITLSNLTVFSATINLNAANHCVLDGCKVLYVSSMFDVKTFNIKHTDFCSPLSTNLPGKGVLVNGSFNTVQNCEIAHSWGNCITILGLSNTVDNCDIHDANWQGWECAALSMNGGGHVIRRNDLHDAQRAALLCTYKFDMGPKAPASLITLNEIYNTGTAKTDNGGIYTFMTDGFGTIISYNWVHDNFNGYHPALHAGCGIYLDNYSQNFIVHHNVIWDITIGSASGAGIRANNPAPNERQPNSHQIYNNTIWNCRNAINSPDKDWNKKTGQPYWRDTKVFNNILLKPITFGPASVGNNFTNADALFADANKHDFRLKVGSPCINSGAVIPGITDGYVGSAPDIGAYEYGGAYWKPGRIHPRGVQ
ncbi:MAG: right-handed parallel beta-helix repeat-containing protein [Verrucomicrobiota bacterium]